MSWYKYKNMSPISHGNWRTPILLWKAAMASGTAGESLRPTMEALVATVGDYKAAAGSVKSLLPKAKGKAKAKSAPKPVE